MPVEVRYILKTRRAAFSPSGLSFLSPEGILDRMVFGPKIVLVFKSGVPRNQNSLSRKVAVSVRKVGDCPYLPVLGLPVEYT
jgi:hypothetical protein